MRQETAQGGDGAFYSSSSENKLEHNRCFLLYEAIPTLTFNQDC